MHELLEYVLLPIGKFILFVIIVPAIIIKLIRYAFRKEQEKNRQAAMKREMELQQQKLNTLANKYAHSASTIQILNCICNGNYRTNHPARIFIARNQIRSILNQETYVFDFVQERLTPLSSNDDKVDPRMAMAIAINQIMHNQYEIYSREATYTPDRESAPYKNDYLFVGNSAIPVTGTIKGIVMELKSNQSF